MLDERGGEFQQEPWAAESGGAGSSSSIQPRRGTLSGSRNNVQSSRNARGNNSRTPPQRQHSPVIYQYFAKSNNSKRSGPPSPDELNFILIGPNVDHWKQVGQILAKRGFNVMACERVEEEHNENSIQGARDTNTHRRSTTQQSREDDAATIDSDAPHLILEVAAVPTHHRLPFVSFSHAVDSLKWNRIVLLGCEEDVVLAMETAMMLAPERVAGLILCGDLTEANRLAQEASGVDD
ncbi:MAG: hypothetical protein SGILL_002258, partial [Bacillariaceae sp.]